jgi:Domain of unknown function (DUF6799)
MKKLLIASVAMMATLNLFAQTDEPQSTNEPQNQNAAVQSTLPDGLMFKDNVVWLYQNGQTKAITEEIWMLNGMQITPTGTLIFANGERSQLKEGDFISLKGAVARPIPIKGETSMTKR